MIKTNPMLILSIDNAHDNNSEALTPDPTLAKTREPPSESASPAQ